MDRTEAKWIMLRHLAEWRRRPYDELVAQIGEHYMREVRGRSGVEYQVEMEAHWDDRPEGSIMLIGAIDDGGWGAWCPLSRSTIVNRPNRDRVCG